MARKIYFSVGISTVGIGFGALCASHWKEGPRTSRSGDTLKALPLNAIGVSAHYAASIPIPKPLRKVAFQSYCSAVGCNSSETNGNLESFASLSEFFARSVRPELRPIDPSAALVVPCDGTVMAAGPVGAYGAIDVKNIKYRIRELMGAGEREPLAETSVSVDDRGEGGSRLWYTVIHLGPENCHRFASPTSWLLAKRRHVEGYMLWMNPNVEGVYTQNERVALLGSWQHGMFAMTAVGAAGRGSIRLETEEGFFRPSLKPRRDRVNTKRYEKPKELCVGQEIGGFRLGSAIVLVFEAPAEGFKFLVKVGDRVRMGEQLASVSTITKLDSFDATLSSKRDECVRIDSRTRFRRAW